MNATRFTPEAPVIALRRPDEFRDLLLDIYQARGNLPHEILRMTSGLYQVMSVLVAEAGEGALERSRPGIRHVQEACDYIAAHYAEDVTVERIARRLGLCRSQLYRVFKAHTGISPQRYLTEFRIREARSIILQGASSVKQVAFAVGFRDPLHFSQVFKSSVGLTPSEYMESVQATKKAEV